MGIESPWFPGLLLNESERSKMKNVIALLTLAAVSGLANADTVSYWDFNNQDLGDGTFGFQVSDFPYVADMGTGEFTVANFNADETGGVYTWLQSFAGTTLGALDGVSGGSFSFQGATGQAVTNNGAQAIFSFDGTNWTDLSFDFARRGTSTGFNSLSIELFDGTTSLGVIDTILGVQSSTWNANNYDLSALNGIADASIVLTFDGASSDTGNNRIDNVTISGTAIPTPGTFALLGLGGLTATRRRRA